MIVLGVDPGFSFSGFGIMKQEKQKTVLLDHGYLKLPQAESLVVRVGIFYDFFKEKITFYQVDQISLETSFLGKNPQNFLKLGYLRGILYLLAAQNNLIIHELAPTQIKLAMTGFGGASKDQVARVILRLFPALKDPKKLDVTDAIAITLCGIWQQQIKRSEILLKR